MGEPDDPGVTPSDATSTSGLPSPLVAMPGLADVARVAADAIVVTDQQRRVVLWNRAAEELSGIDGATAVGAILDDLFDSTVVGHDADARAVDDLAIRNGRWRGRMVYRPRVGRLRDREFVVENVVSRLDDALGTTVGLLSIKRDVTTAVRIEQELLTLGALPATTGAMGGDPAIAQGVLDLLVRSAGAVMGTIIGHEDDRATVWADHGLPEEVHRFIEELPVSSSPLIASLGSSGAVVSGAVDDLPMREESRPFIRGFGIGAIAAVGLHRGDRLVGSLILGFASIDDPRPSNSTLLQAAAHVQLALDNARLVAQLEARGGAERRLVDQQLTLQSLTELSESSADFGELAPRTIAEVARVLGAASGTYTLLGPDGDAIEWFSHGLPAKLIEGIRTIAARPETPLRRFAAGEGPFMESCADDASVDPGPLAIACEAGWTGYAALPVRIAGNLEGTLLLFYTEPLDPIGAEPRTLEAIARMVSISLGNFRLRQRLLDSEKRYRKLFESSPEPYLVESMDGTVLDANAAACRLFGGTVEQLRGLRLEQQVRLSAEEAAFRRGVARTQRTSAFRGIGLRLDGTTFPQEAITSIVELEGEQRILVLVRDLTDQSRLQQELIQAQKMDAIGQLVSGVAHELNNPLAAILGFGQLIRSDPRLPTDLHTNADLLVEEATRTRRIVQNLLDFARQRPPERHPVAIRTLVESVLLLQSYSLGPGRIEVDVDVPEDLPLIALDRSQIQQVIINLIQNAIHAIRTAGAGRIRIVAATDGPSARPRVRISVIDDGPGVAPEHIDRLFVPFFTTKDPMEGTGLGLPVSYGIVAAHGGDLTYAPGPDGRGAVFTFDLPASTSGSAPPIDQSRPRTAGPGAGRAAPPMGSGPERTDGLHRVLVLDDERSIRLLLEKALTGAGYTLVLAGSGEEAVELVRVGTFDAVLCDHRMAGMNGTEVYEAIIGLRPELGGRFVFMSGDVLNPGLREFAEERGVGLLAKPFDLESVARTLRALLYGPDHAD